MRLEEAITAIMYIEPPNGHIVVDIATMPLAIVLTEMPFSMKLSEARLDRKATSAP